MVLWLVPAGAAPLRVGTVAWAGFSALNVAEVKGFWKDQGLEVEVLVYGSNQEVNAGLVFGRIDIALDMIGSWVGLHQAGHDIIILGEGDWSHGGDKIIAKLDFDPGSFKGRKVGIYLNQPSVTIFLERFLRSHRLTLGDVELVEKAPQELTDAFISGDLTVIVNYDPQALRAASLGNGRVFATSASYPGIIPEGYAARRDHWQAVPEANKLKFWRGILRAVAWLERGENWAEYQRILNEKTFPYDDPFSEAQLREMVDAVHIHNSAKLRERNSRNGGLERYLDDMEAFLSRNKMLRRPFRAGQLLQTQTFMEAIDSGER